MSESGLHRGVERANLADLQVEVNEEKSRIVDLSRGESFGFLGFDLERYNRAPFICQDAWPRPEYVPWTRSLPHQIRALPPAMRMASTSHGWLPSGSQPAM